MNLSLQDEGKESREVGFEEVEKERGTEIEAVQTQGKHEEEDEEEKEEEEQEEESRTPVVEGVEENADSRFHRLLHRHSLGRPDCLDRAR